MIEWTVLEWDLATPVREELRNLGCNILHHIDLDNKPAVMPPHKPVMTLKALGKLVEAQLPKGVPEQAKRSDAQFMWVDLRIVFEEGEGLTLADFEKIRNDPLLHQRLFDAVQTVFRKACQEIARQIKWYDDELSKSPNRAAVPGGVQERDHRAIDLAIMIKTSIITAQHEALQKLVGVETNLDRELAGRQTGLKKAKVYVKIGLGVLAVVCCAAAIASTVMSGGVLAPLFIGVAATAGSRSLVDTIKGAMDQYRSAETIGKRLENAIKLFQASKSKNGAKRTAEAIANATVKFGAVAYNLFGFGKCASLHDIADDIKLYEEKLNTLRANAHELSKELNDKLNEMEDMRIKGSSNVTVKITPQERDWLSKKESVINDLIIKTSDLHLKCDQQLAALPALKEAVAEVLESKGKVYLKLEKWLDFGINLSQTGIGGWGGFSSWGAMKWADVFTVLGTADDAVSEAEQAMSPASSKFES